MKLHSKKASSSGFIERLDNFSKFDVQCFGRHLNQVVLVLEIRHVCSTAEFRVHRALKEKQDNR